MRESRARKWCIKRSRSGAGRASPPLTRYLRCLLRRRSRGAAHAALWNVRSAKIPKQLGARRAGRGGSRMRAAISQAATRARGPGEPVSAGGAWRSSLRGGRGQKRPHEHSGAPSPLPPRASEHRWPIRSDHPARVGGEKTKKVPLGQSKTRGGSPATVSWRAPANQEPAQTKPAPRLNWAFFFYPSERKKKEGERIAPTNRPISVAGRGLGGRFLSGCVEPRVNV